MKNKRSNLFIFILALCCGLIEGRKEAFRAFSYGHGKSFDKNQRSKTDSSWENNHTIPFVYGTFLPAALSRSIKPDLQSFDLLDCKGQKTVLEKFGLHRWGAKHRFGIRYFNKTFSLTPYVLTHPGSILEQNSGHGPALLHNATLTPHPILTPNENLVKQIQYTEQPEIRLQDFSNDLNDHESQEIGTDLDRCHDESEKKTPEKTLVAQKMDFESDIDDKDDGAPVASIVLTEHDQPTQPLVHEAKVLIQHNRPTQPAAPGTTKKVINISHTVNESIDPALVWTAAYDPITPTYDPITPTYDPITPTFIPNKREEAGLILSLTAPAATPIADELAAATPIAPAATPIADELAEQNLAPIAVQQRKTDKKTRKKKAKVGQQRKEEAQQRIAQQKAQLEQQQIVEQKRKADELAAELARKELAAQLEQQRIASAQLEKKLADEEAARLAKKAAEKAAEIEQQRIAAEEAEEARKKQEEDEKAAAEEARLAQLEQQRKKQEAEQQRIAKEAEAADLAAQLAKEVEEKRKADEAAQLAKEVEEKRKADELAKARIADLAKQEAEEADAEEADAADEESDEKAQNVPNLSLGNNPFCAAADEEVKVEGKVKNVQKLSIICSDGLASRNNSLIPRAPEQSDKHKKRLQSTLAELLQMSYNVQVQNQNPPDNVQLQRQVGPKGKNRNAPAGNQVLAKTNTKPNKQQADELAKQKAELEEQQRQEEARKKQLAAQLKAQQQVMAEERIVQNKAAEKAQLTNAEKARLADLAEAEQQRLAEVRKTQEKLKADKEAQKKLAVQVAQQQKADLEEKQRIAKEAAAAVKLAQAQTRRVKQKAGEKRKADKLKAEELEVALKNQEKRKANKEVWNKQKADEAAVQLEKNLAELAEEQQRIAAKVWNKKKADELAKERIAALAAAEEAQLEEVQLEEVQKKGIADDQLKAQLAAAQQKLLIQEPGSNQIESRILEESKDNIITQELECVALKNCDHNHDHEITQEQEKFIELTNCFELRDGKIFQLVLNAQYDPKTRTGKTESSYTKFINGERTNRVGEIKGLFGWKQDRTLGRVQDTFAVKILDINGFTISPTTSDKAQEVVFIGKKCTLYKTEDKYFIKNNEEGAKFKHYNITPPKKEVMFSPQVMFSQQNIKGESKYRGCCTTGNGSRPDAKRQNFVQKNFVLKREGGGICLTEWEYDAQALKNDLKNDPTNWGEIGDRTGTFKMNASLPPDNGELPYSEMPHYKRGGVVASLHPDDGRGQTSPVQRVFGLEIQNVSASATGSENSSGKKSSATGNDHSSAEKIQKKIGNTQNIQTVKNAEKFVNKITDEVKLRKSILRNVR